MLINLSNHPSESWEGKQLEAACRYGDIQDIPFPDIVPQLSHEEICLLADEYAAKIARLARDCDVTVHVMGEMTFTYAVVSTLKDMGIRCVASTTERIVKESEGKRTYTFRFCQFREY